MKACNIMWNGQRKAELAIYGALWTLLFLAPVLTIYAESHSHHAAYDWNSVVQAWRMLAVFFVVFVVHNTLLAPLLVYGGRRRVYVACVMLLLVGYGIFQATTDQMPPQMQGMEQRFHPRADRHRLAPDRQMTEHRSDMHPTRHADRNDRHRMRPKDNRPPLFLGGRQTMDLIIMLLLLGLNLATKYFFKSAADQKHMKELEKENLQRQLEYLRYQLSPHFFMNTLNNIHALVDIDPEQARHTIEVLSQLMRYLLYEGDKPMVPLQREVDFIANYIDLMRIRYANDLRITTDLSPMAPDVLVPPLLFITYVENAFKHGVSYEHPSFIEVSVRVTDGDIVFCCRNSRKSQTANAEQGGLGLANADKRLRLIYGNDYSLHIDRHAGVFQVDLRLPVRRETDPPTDQSDKATACGPIA